MDLRSLREVASGLLLAALLCSLPVVAGAAPAAEQEPATAEWWHGLHQRVAEAIALWWPPSPAVSGAQKVRDWEPPVDGPPRPPRWRVIAKDGGNNQCTGEGGPGWDPDGCQ